MSKTFDEKTPQESREEDINVMIGNLPECNCCKRKMASVKRELCLNCEDYVATREREAYRKALKDIENAVQEIATSKPSVDYATSIPTNKVLYSISHLTSQSLDGEERA